MIVTISSFFIAILVIGYFTLRKRYFQFDVDHKFAYEYREEFIVFANHYFGNHNQFPREQKIDHEKYIWLTKNVNKIQEIMGQHGRMYYVAAFQMYKVPNYEIIVNTIPKFRDGKVTDFDISSVDDALLRYLGAVENLLNELSKKLRNPFIWFRVGFQEVISLPFYVLRMFGILTERGVSRVISSSIYRVLAGIGGLVAFLSGIVTIIVGKEQTIEYLKSIFGRQ